MARALSTRLRWGAGEPDYRLDMTGMPFELVRPTRAGSPLLFLCDHASSALPPAYGTLGLTPALFATHIAADIGAAEVTRTLAAAFGAPAVLARWSRLLIDLNRGEDDPTLVMKLSDGSIIPGNARTNDAETKNRIESFHAPYHAAIAAEIAALRAAGTVPVIVSMHSFTPVWKGVPRPWEIGILWDRDGRLAKPLLTEFARAGFAVGDNEPYDGELEGDCLYRHGTMLGLPHVLIEMRQDLIADAAAARAFADRIKPALDRALAAMGPPAIQFTRPLPAAAPSTGSAMDERTREQLEAAAFRRLVAHLRERSDVQNIDLMTLAGFCRNCLGDWYREAAAEKGVALDKDAAREIVYGMPPSEWKKRYQREATPEQQAAFAASQKTHK
jgi:predicted N-formylglutamate amidohydrolase